MRWRLSGTGWHLAAGLQVLARQVDAVWPKSHPADGTLGNLSHSSRTSDHNPDGNGVVRALDIGEVVENDAMIVAEAIRKSRDKRIKYVIHEARMFSSYWKNEIPPFTWRSYSGVNLHWSHVHISTLSKYDNFVGAWAIGVEGGDELAHLSEDQQKELSDFLNHLDSIGSNVGFVKFIIPWYRKWRSFLPKDFLKRGDNVDLT